MKKLSSIFLLILMCNFSYAQEYSLPFPENNTAWITSEFGGHVGEEFSAFYKDFTKGIDTVYNDTAYHTLFRGNTSPTDLSSNNINGFYRVDSLNVFYRISLNDFNKEVILYDFGMQVGDTFVPDPNWAEGSYILDSIDSIEIAGYFYRKFHFTGIDVWGGDGEYWVEGIGSNSGFFPFQRGGEWAAILSCFYTNNHGISINYNFEIQACDYSIGIAEDLLDTVTISPNPVSDFINIEGDLSQCDFILYDYAGKIISQGKASSTLDVSAFENGVYFLQFIREGQIQSKTKLLVCR